MDMNQAEIYKDLFQLTRNMFFRLQGRIQPYQQISNQLQIYLNEHQSRNYHHLKSLLFDEPLNIKLEQDSDLSKEKKKEKQLKRTSKHKFYCKLCRKYFKDNLNLIRHQYVQHGIKYIFDYPENYIDQMRFLENQDKKYSFDEIQENYKLFEEQDNQNQILNTIEEVELFNQIHPIQCKKNQRFIMVRKTFQKTVKIKKIKCNICSQSFQYYEGLIKHQVKFHDLKKDSLQFRKKIISEFQEQNRNHQQSTYIIAKKDIIIHEKQKSLMKLSNDCNFIETNNGIDAQKIQNDLIE